MRSALDFADMFWFDRAQIVAALLSFGLLAGASGTAVAAVRIEGQVQASGALFANSTVTLWQASNGAARQLAQTKAGSDGRFDVNSQETPGAGAILYLVSKGGAAASSSENAATAMLLVLNNAPPSKVVINELTTVASAFTAARFISGESISGNPLGLRIAAGNVPNLVDPATGSWGKVVLDQTNLTHTTTLANLNTLGSLIAAFATVANNDWRDRFLKAATPIGGTHRKARLKQLRPSLARHGSTRTSCTRCSIKPIRSRAVVADARRHSSLISPTVRLTSRSCSASAAVGFMLLANSYSTLKAISGPV
jgi:hypothetical protein